MKKRNIIFILFVLVIYTISPVYESVAQTNDPKHKKKNKAEKEAEEILSYARVYSLINSQQFVFKADFGQSSDEVFVVVDSSYAMIQNGNRNNLDGQITRCEIKKDDKRKTIAITIMMRGAMSTADVFIFVGASGSGKATIKSDFPGYFSFDGQLLDFENATIYDGGSHFVH